MIKTTDSATVFMAKTLSCAVLLVFSLTILGCGSSQPRSEPESSTIKGAKSGAGLGALAGLVFGGSLSDVASGAVTGAVVGTAIGGVAGHEEQKKAQAETEAERLKVEQERLKLEQQRNAAAISDNTTNQSTTSAAQKWGFATEQEFIAALGEDNVRGYYALRDCQHSRAQALAQVGRTSSKQDHQLTAVWLEAMIAVDQRNTNAAESIFNELIKKDPDIDTAQQAGIETDKALMDMRNERRSLNIQCG